MFPLNNLSRYGLDGPQPFSLRFWVGASDGTIGSALGLTREGTRLPPFAKSDFRGARQALKGCKVDGVIGPESQVRPLLNVLELPDEAMTVDADEPQFALDLAELRVPEGD